MLCASQPSPPPKKAFQYLPAFHHQGPSSPSLIEAKYGPDIWKKSLELFYGCPIGAFLDNELEKARCLRLMKGGALVGQGTRLEALKKARYSLGNPPCLEMILDDIEIPLNATLLQWRPEGFPYLDTVSPEVD